MYIIENRRAIVVVQRLLLFLFVMPQSRFSKTYKLNLPTKCIFDVYLISKRIINFSSLFGIVYVIALTIYDY